MSTPPKLPAVPATANQRNAQAVDDFVRNELQRRTNVMKAMFAEAGQADRRQISKALFMQHFLPFFAGELQPTKQFLAAWTSVAATPYAPVEVVEDGLVIAVVPPLTVLSQHQPKGRGQRGGTISDVLATASQVGHINPRGAQERIVDNLTQRYNSKAFSPMDEHRQAWEDMLNVFGKSLAPKLEAKPGAAAAADDDFYEFG